MKAYYKFLFLTSLIMSSCGKEHAEVENNSNALRLKAFNSFSDTMKTATVDIDYNRVDSVGKGYRSISKTSASRCLDNQTSVFYLAPSANIDYQMDLSQQQLLNKIGVGVSATIPVAVSGVPVTISPELSYSRESGSTNFTRTATTTIKIIKGRYELSKINQNKAHRIKDNYYKSLVENTSEFYRICGDRIINKQNAEASLVMTTIFRFRDSNTKSGFDAAVGASIPNPFSFGGSKTDLKSNDKTTPPETKKENNTAKTDKDAKTTTDTKAEGTGEKKPEGKIAGIVQKVKDSGAIDKVKNLISPPKSGGSSGGGMSPDLKVKFSSMSQETLKNVTIEIKAIQFGGDPIELPKIIATTCSPDNISSCDKMFADIQNYAAENFPNQLDNLSEYTDESSNAKFSRGGVETIPYDELEIEDSQGKLLNSKLSKYTDESLEFINTKNDISNAVNQEYKDFATAEEIKYKPHYDSLTTDEKIVVENTIKIADRNTKGLDFIAKQCFGYKGTCQLNFNKYKDSSSKYEAEMHYNRLDLYDIRAWNLIASTEANWRPVRYILGIYSSDRITSDFFSPTNLRGYKKFFIKYVSNKEPNKGIKITKINSGGISLSTSFRCYNWFSDAVGSLWLHERQANEVIELGKGEELVNYCGSKTAFACTFNSDLQKISPFIMQIWAE